MVQVKALLATLPGARAASISEAVSVSDVVILATPGMRSTTQARTCECRCPCCCKLRCWDTTKFDIAQAFTDQTAQPSTYAPWYHNSQQARQTMCANIALP